ncbi:MAG: hypothetical protein KBF71_07250 [Alphaproteobacteria bacterium]|nr:hypothetical protein [Alphaproteobacteria bacterium]
MTGTTELSAIITQENLTQNIASHLTNPLDIQSFSFTNKSIYHLLTTSNVAKSLWGQFIASHNQKIPPSLYVTLAFHPRVHRYEDGLTIDTLSVFELRLSQPLENRSVMQIRQIPYIENPALHLLGRDKKLEDELSLVRLIYSQYQTPYIRPTRQVVMRKEILNWLYCLYGNFRRPDLREVNMFNSYVRSAFEFHLFFHEMVGDDYPDLDLTELRANGLLLNGQSGREYLTYQKVLDVLLSGVISFDQFKSLMCPTKKVGSFNIPQRLDPSIFDLFQEVQDFETVKNHPLETLLFFKKINDMIKRDPAQIENQELRTRLNNVLVSLVALPHFSCPTFCAVFLKTEIKQQRIELLIQRLSLFLEAVRDGIFTLDTLNSAFERNPNLEIPLIDMSPSFYEAVRSGFISISSLLNRTTPLSDFYVSSNLITTEVDAHAYGIVDQPQFFELTRQLNQFHTRFMTLAINSPHQKTDRHTFIREANQFLQLMVSLSNNFMRRLTVHSDVEYAFSLFLAFREKTQNRYRDAILEHIKDETHQDMILSGAVKEFIFPREAWRATLPNSEYESYQTWLNTIEETSQKPLTTHNFITQLRILSTCSTTELQEAVQQMKLLSDHQDPQKLSPAMVSLMSLHTGLSGKMIEEFYHFFGPLIPLFKECDFPVQFSLWDLIKASDQRSIDLMIQSIRQSVRPWTWSSHLTSMKNEALRLGALFFGTAGGYQICQSFFNSPKRMMQAFLLLSTEHWTKEDYSKIVRTFISMHYNHNCSGYYQYEPMVFSTRSRRPMPEINVGLPDETSNHAFDPHIFVDEILATTLTNFLYDSNKSARTLWNDACHTADKGQIGQ